MSYPYQPPPAPDGGYGNYQVSQPGRGLAIAALVLGILAILSTWIPLVGLFLMVLSLAAIITGIIALVMTTRGRARGKGMAVAGIILGVLSIVTSIVAHVLVFRAVDSLVTDVSSSLSASGWSSGTSGSASGGSAGTSDAGAEVTLGTASTSAGLASVPVTVTNTTQSDAVFTVTVEAVVDGNVVMSSPTMATVGPGETETVSAGFITRDQDLSGATFQVASVSNLSEELDVPTFSSPDITIPTEVAPTAS